MFLCTLTLCNPSRKRDRSSPFCQNCRTQIQKRTLHKACTPQHLCRGYLKFSYSNFWCFKPTVLRKHQSARDNKRSITGWNNLQWPCHQRWCIISPGHISLPHVAVLDTPQHLKQPWTPLFTSHIAEGEVCCQHHKHTLRICLTSRILNYAQWHFSSSQEAQIFSKSTEERWFIVPKPQQTSDHHIVNECIIHTYAGHIKGIHQASLDSAERFSNLGLNLQSVIAFQNAIHKRKTEPGELMCLERRKTNKPTNEPNLITFQPLLSLNN